MACSGAQSGDCQELAHRRRIKIAGHLLNLLTVHAQDPTILLHVQAARLQPGDPLLVDVPGDGKIVLVRDHDPLDDFVGAVPGLTAATDLERLRGEWDR